MKSLLRSLACGMLFALVCPTSAWALRYFPYKLFELASVADLIVSGTIRSVDQPVTTPNQRTPDAAGYFVVEVEATIAGQAPSESVRVRCFQDWTCAARWAPYAPGQRVLLFLRPAAPGSQIYTILSGGGEGEMPLFDQSVCVRGYEVHGFTSGVHDYGAHRVYGPLVPLDEFTRAVVGFRETYTCELNADGWTVGSVRAKNGLAPALIFTESSATARHLHEEAVASHAWRGERARLPLPPNARSISAVANGLSGPARIAPDRQPNPPDTELFTNFGRSAAFVGDIDGNGFEDLAVGAPTDSYLGRFHGAVWIVFLRSDLKVERFAEISEQAGGLSASMNELARFGASVAPVGDLDGNGIPDLAVGAPGWNGPERKRGGVWLLSLALSGGVVRSHELGAEPKLREAGVGSDYGLGSSLTNLGDLDGDGFPELAIGQDPATDTSFHQRRAVLIVSLGKSGEVRWARRIDGHADSFHTESASFGDALAGIGDVDGDGVNDLAIGSTNDADGGERGGAVWIVFLNPDGTMKTRQKISATRGKFSGALHDGSQFGSALAGAGDLDSDGSPDLLVSSTDGVWTLFLDGEGCVRSHSLLTIDQGGVDQPTSIGSSIATNHFQMANGTRMPNGTRTLVLGGTFPFVDEIRNSGVWFIGLTPEGKPTSW